MARSFVPEGKNLAFKTESKSNVMSPIRVLLIDEEVVIRAGMRILIDSWPTSRVVGEADGSHEAVATMESVNPDLIVFSHKGRSIESLDGLSDLLKAAGRVPVGLLTSSHNPNVGAVAVQAGAKWVLMKHNAPIALRNAIENGQSEEQPDDQLVMSSHMDAKFSRRSVLDPNGTLTDREREVAVLASRGCTNKQVGKHLGITEVTVRHHLTSIFNKIGVANRFELMAWALSSGIVGPAKFV